MSNKKSSLIFVNNFELMEDIVNDSPRHNHNKNYPSKRGVSLGESTDTTVETAESLLRERRAAQDHQTNSLMKQNIQKTLEKLAVKQEQRFPVLLTKVDNANTFLNAIEKDINLHEETQRNKTRRQFEEWNLNVHGDIQKKISKQVNSIDSKELNRLRNEDFEKFLNITNRKPSIFRDIIIESEYDPLEPNRRSIKARTGLLKDPTHLDELKAKEEASMLGASTGINLRKQNILGKETLNVELWASGKIEATPYGTFARMMKYNKGEENKPKVVSATMKSSIVFDHFTFPTGKEAILSELPKGKRIHPTTIYSDPGRIFGAALPKEAEAEIAAIKPPENYSWNSRSNG
eukprot:gene12195-16338_t